MRILIDNFFRHKKGLTVSDASRRLFPDFLRAQNMVRVIEGKII